MSPVTGRVDPMEALVRPVEAEPRGPASEPPTRVLVVDDSPLARLLITRILTRDGRFEVVGEARDGREGAEMAAALRPDVITMDVMMPVLSGIDAARCLHAAERTRYTGQPLTESPEDYVILVDTPRSIAILGTQAAAFAEYQRDLLQIKQLMDKTVETQGRLETALGDIARLEERFAF